jgi:hypothetical protein
VDQVAERLELTKFTAPPDRATHYSASPVKRYRQFPQIVNRFQKNRNKFTRISVPSPIFSLISNQNLRSYRRAICCQRREERDAHWDWEQGVLGRDRDCGDADGVCPGIGVAYLR